MMGGYDPSPTDRKEHDRAMARPAAPAQIARLESLIRDLDVQIAHSSGFDRSRLEQRRNVLRRALRKHNRRLAKSGSAR